MILEIRIQKEITFDLIRIEISDYVLSSKYWENILMTLDILQFWWIDRYAKSFGSGKYFSLAFENINILIEFP